MLGQRWPGRTVRTHRGQDLIGGERRFRAHDRIVVHNAEMVFPIFERPLKGAQIVPEDFFDSERHRNQIGTRHPLGLIFYGRDVLPYITGLNDEIASEIAVQFVNADHSTGIVIVSTLKHRDEFISGFQVLTVKIARSLPGAKVPTILKVESGGGTLPRGLLRNFRGFCIFAPPENIVDMKFLTLVPVLFFSLALGFHICDRVYMFQEMINHIYGMNEKGAILWLVILLFVLNAISAVAAIIAAFSDRNKAVAKV